MYGQVADEGGIATDTWRFEVGNFGDGRYPERVRRPKRFFDDEPGQASQAVATAFTCEDLRFPRVTVEEAMSRPDAHLWREAMRDELESLLKNNAWEVTDLPQGSKLTGSRWVLDLKRDAAGHVARYKARFVVRGLTQKPGVDYDEVWAPTPAKAPVRAVLALAAAQDMAIHYLDIKTAYLNALLDKDVYVAQPTGFAVGAKGKVCHILRAVYGCKQSSFLWGKHFAATLAATGAVRSAADPCLFVWHHPTHGAICILVHGDDVLLTASALAGIQAIKKVITTAYAIRDLGEIGDFLGMRVIRASAFRVLVVCTLAQVQAWKAPAIPSRPPHPSVFRPPISDNVTAYVCT